MLHTGLPCACLPREMGCGSGMLCWRHLRELKAAGVWAALHRALLDRLDGAAQLDWRRAALDGASITDKRMARPVRKWLWIR